MQILLSFVNRIWWRSFLYLCLLEFIRRHSAILPNNENIFKLGNLLNKIYFWIKGRKITSSKSCIYFYLLKAICSTGMVWTTKLLRTMQLRNPPLVTTLYVRDSQFQHSCGYWNLQSIIIFEYNTFKVRNLDRIWSISYYFWCKKFLDF